MDSKLLLGLWRAMIPVPRALWQRMILQEMRKAEKRLDFMTPEHRTVHHFVVRELPCTGGPLSPECAAREVGLPVERVKKVSENSGALPPPERKTGIRTFVSFTKLHLM